jgi:hypothetical protein
MAEVKGSPIGRCSLIPNLIPKMSVGLRGARHRLLDIVFIAI